MTPITTLNQFRASEDAGAPILITDNGTGGVVHVLPCKWVRAEYFEEKVLKNRGKNGGYFELTSAIPLPAGARRCPGC